MSEPLETEVVYHHLKWSWSFFGLGVFHLLCMALPALMYVWAASWWDESLPKSFGLPIFVTSLAVILALHFRQRPGWIDRFLANAAVAPVLSPRLRTQMAPFPVTREELR
ncbi:MAG TPA: hypothetical protein VFH51_00650 [Myxococcota bacterium]|nr:hypothetical protein [Myxococcota bacterium]